jgi:predicted O-methyltransferase YrrM
MFGFLKSAPEWQPWFEGKTFSADWLGDNLDQWLKHLAPLRQSGDALQILELGSYEGRSAVAFLEMFPAAHVTAVDIFRNPEKERNFDGNLAPYGERCTKIKDRVIPAMDRLSAESRLFDLIYLDATKRRDDTLTCSVLAWSLLKVGGIVIWDDLKWKRRELPSAERPGPAIDLFAKIFGECMVELHRGYQLMARKTKEWPGEK